MDQNPSERSPLSLSPSFYDEATKGMQSPVLSKEFYDSATKSAATTRTPVEPVAPARYELASPGEIAETVKAGLEIPLRLPLQVAGAAASAIRGGDPAAVADKNSFLTKIIDVAAKDSEEYQKKYAENKVVIAPLTKIGLPADIDTQTLTRFPQQQAFSAVSAAAGLGAGIPAGAAATAVTSPVGGFLAGRAAGMAASGGAAYRMQKDNSTQQLYEKLNETSNKTLGRAMSPEEWQTAYDKNEKSLVEQGIAEAIPEAIGNLVGFELFFGAAKNVFGKKIAKSVIGKALGETGTAVAAGAGKLLAEQANEQFTETWTQQWQNNIDVEMGLKPGESKRSWTSFEDLRKSNQEVFADILFLTAVGGGVGLVGGHIQSKMDTAKSAQLVKDVVAENKFASIPNEFLPSFYTHADDLAKERPSDKDLVAARDAFATEMDKRGIDFDMTSKFKEYLNLDAAVRGDDATGDDIARWVSLRDEFKEKNISPDIYQQYLSYQDDINRAVGLQRRAAAGKATGEDKTEFDRLVGSITDRATVLGFPEDALGAAGVARGGVVNKPVELPKSSARDALLGDEPADKKNATTAKGLLTGDLDIQSEADLENPEVQAGINKVLGEGGATGAGGIVGGARAALEPKPPQVVDITETVNAQDKEQFAQWDADTTPTGSPAFIRNNVDKLFAEGGDAAVLGVYPKDDTTSRYAKYRMEQLKTAPAEEAAAAAEPAAAETPLTGAAAWKSGDDEAGRYYSSGTEDFYIRPNAKETEFTVESMDGPVGSPFATLDEAVSSVDKLRSGEGTAEAAVTHAAVEDTPPVVGVVGGAKAPAVEAIDQAAQEAATSPTNTIPEPTDAQREAGNYKMGHVNLEGLDISIENPTGSVRKGIDSEGKPWEMPVAYHYGYIKKTEGKDGDHVDTILGPNPDSGNVFVLDQQDPKTQKFDEHKTLIGFNTLDEARAGYLTNHDQTGESRIMGITEMPMADFKEWLKGDTTKRVSKAGEAAVTAEAVVTGARAPQGAATGATETPAVIAAETKPLNDLVGDFVDKKKTEGTAEADLRKIDKMRHYNEAALNGPDGLASLPQALQDEFAEYQKNPTPAVIPQEAAPAGGKAAELSPIEKELASMSDNFDSLDETPAAKPEGERAPITGGRREGVPDVVATAAEAGAEGAAPETPAPRGAKDAAQALEIAAKHGLEGAADAFKGLYELFGGSSLKSFPGGLDRGTYDKAKPFFETAYKHAVDMGKSVKEFYDIVVEMIGDTIKPYVKHFLAVKRAEILGEEAPAFPAAEGTVEIVGGERAGEKLIEPVNLDEEKPAAEGEKVVGGARAPRGKKLQDTGVMAGKLSGKTHAERVQLIKISLDTAAVGEPAAIVKAIVRLTTKADIFKINELVEGRTPGLTRWLKGFRSSLTGFLEYAGRRQGGGRGKYSTSYHDALVETVATPAGQEVVRESAAKYIALLEQIQEATSDSLSISQAVQNIYAKLLAKDTGMFGAAPTAYDFEQSNDPAALLGDFGKDFTSHSGHSRLIHLSGLKHQLGEAALDMMSVEMDETRNRPIVRRSIPIADIVTSDEYRHGANVSAVDLKAVLGLRNVEYGEWANAAHRQISTNLTYDSGFDLAAILGAPVQGIAAPFMGERLGMAFASRGRGHAAAHYEPDTDVVNLTKTHGDGSLAHELMHRLHHKLHITHPSKDGAQINVFEDMINSLMVEYHLENLEQKIEDILRGLDPDIRRWSPTGNRLEDARKYLTEDMEAHLKSETKFFRDAKELDGNEQDKYWSKRTELLSRAFEGFVADELQGTNQYLVDVDFVAPGAVEALFNRSHAAYPSAQERETFNLLFSRLWAGMVWAEDGTVTMKPDFVLVSEQQRADADAAVKQVMDKLEAWYNLIYTGKQSADGLYWYAYEVAERGAMMQPAGFGAYDDAHRIPAAEPVEGAEVAEVTGKGAVGYLDQLNADEVVKYRFVPIVHETNSTTIPVKEDENGLSGDEDQTTMGEGASANGGETGGAGGPGGGRGVRGGSSDTGNGLVDAEGNPVVVSGGDGAGSVDVSDGAGTGPLDAGSDALLADRIDFVIHSVDSPVNASKAAAFTGNIAAIRTLKKIEAENRRATAEEQKILFQFQGWGNLSEALAGSPNDAWKDRAEMLRQELTDDERADARRNMLTGYYTPLGIYDSIYRALSKFGFSEGRILFPAFGIGHEAGVMPAQMRRNSKISAVEMDSLSARIAQQLYQSIEVQNKSFEKVAMPEEYFDLSIANVPFNNDLRPYDAQYNPDRFPIHDYFINKQMAGVRSGGLLVIITTHGTMDNDSRQARESWAKQADLVGAIRLPNGTFKDQGTDVMTDILIFRKRFSTDTANGIKFTDQKDITVPPKEGTRPWNLNQSMNEYFVDHPEMVSGTLDLQKNRWGDWGIVNSGPHDGTALTDLIDAAIQTLPDGIYQKTITHMQSDIADRIPAPDFAKDGGLFLRGEAIMINTGGTATKWEPKIVKSGKNRDVPEGMKPVDYIDHVKKMMRAYVGLRGTMRALLKAQYKNDPAMETIRKKLNDDYYAFVGTVDPKTGKRITGFGRLGDRNNLKQIMQDVDGGQMAALEIWRFPQGEGGVVSDLETDLEAELLGDVAPEEKPAEEGPAEGVFDSLQEIFYKNTAKITEPPVSAANASDALLHSLMWKGKVDLPYMENLTGIPRADIVKQLQGLIYDDPKSWWVTADEYLSGDIKDKLKAAQEAAAIDPAYAENVRQLQTIVPVDLQPHQIPANLGAPWIASSHISAFANSLMRRNQIEVTYIPLANTWTIDVTGSTKDMADDNKRTIKESVAATSTWGTHRKNFLELLEYALNGGMPRVMGGLGNPDPVTGARKDYTIHGATARDRDVHLFNPDETDAAYSKLEEIRTKFDSWAWADPTRAETLAKRYNDLHNQIVDRKFDGSHLQLPGKVPDEIIKLLPHQLNAVWRYLTTGRAFFAHEVGVGKTYAMVASIMESRRLGLANKPVFAVKGPTIDQIRSDFYRLYPGANVLTVDMTGDSRVEDMRRIATGNYDAIIMSHEALQRIPVSPETEIDFKRREVEKLERALQASENSTTAKWRKKSTERELQKKLDKLRAKIDKLQHQEREEGISTFEEMGIDMLVIDEAHAFKNLDIDTNYQGVKGLHSKESLRAGDIFMKTQYLLEKNKRGLIFATGTPLSNSIGELYSIQQHFQSAELSRTGIDGFDQWVATFGVIGQSAEPSPEGGGYQQVTRFLRFRGIPELMAKARKFMDLVTADEIGIPRPTIANASGKADLLRVPQSRWHQRHQLGLMFRADNIRQYPGHIEDKPAGVPKSHKHEWMDSGLRELTCQTCGARWVGANYHQVPDLMLRILHDGRDAALDPRIIDPSLPDNPLTKTNYLVKEVFALYQADHEAEDPYSGEAYTEKKGVQLIFSDRGVPGTDRFSVYDDIKNKLVAMGVPPSEIAFIQEATQAKGGPREKELAKRKLLERAREGKVRILIGGTQNLGTGTNVQDRVVAIHNLDADWNAANQTQRIGRAIRRGNRIRAVYVNNYGVNKGVDAFMWATVGQKQYVLSQVLSKNPLLRDSEDIAVDDLGAREFAAVLADDPLVLEKHQLDSEVRRLRSQRGVFDLTKREQQAELQGIPPHIERLREAMKPLIKGNEIIQPATAIKIGEEFYDLAKDGGKVNALAEKVFAEDFMKEYFADRAFLADEREKLREKYTKLKKKTQQDNIEWQNGDRDLIAKFAQKYKINVATATGPLGSLTMEARPLGRLGYITEEKMMVKAEKSDLPAAFTATATGKENVISLTPPAKKTFTAEEKTLVKSWAKKNGYTLTEGEAGYSVAAAEGVKIELPVPGTIPEVETVLRKFNPVGADARVEPANLPPDSTAWGGRKENQFIIRAGEATVSTDHEVKSGFNRALTAFKTKHTDSINDYNKEIADLEEKAVTLEEDIQKLFPKTQELQEKTARQQFLTEQLVEVQRQNEERRRAEAEEHAREDAEAEARGTIVAEGTLPPLPANFRAFRTPGNNSFSIFPAEGKTFTDEERERISKWADAQVFDIEEDGTGFRIMKIGVAPIEVPVPTGVEPGSAGNTGMAATPEELTTVSAKLGMKPGEGILINTKTGDVQFIGVKETPPVVQDQGKQLQRTLDEVRRTAKQKWGGELFDGDTGTQGASQDVLDKLADLDQPDKAAYARDKVEFLTFGEFYDATSEEEYDTKEDEIAAEKVLRAEYDQRVYDGESSPTDYYTWTAKQVQAIAVVAQYDGNREEGAVEAQRRLDAVKDAWVEENADDPRSPEFEEAIQAAQKVITTVRSGQTLLFPDQHLYSVQKDMRPGVKLADVQAVFQGQEVIQPGGENSPVYIKTRGGQYLTIEKVNFISPDEVEFELTHGEKFDPKTMTITGTYGQGNIRLRRDKAGKWTLVHEVEHFLEDAGIINAEDINILRSHIQRQVEKGKITTANRKDIGGAEDRANFLATTLAKEPPGGLVGLVIARVQKFLDRLGAAFGVRTAGMVAREVASGKIYEREGKHVGEEGEVYSAAQDGSLAFIHTLSIDNLRHAIKMGGLAVPSTAVIDVNKSSFNRFGEITLIASAERLGPSASKQNKYFNADAYSPRYPEVHHFLTPKSAKALDAYLDPIWKEIPKAADRQGGIPSSYVIEDRIKKDGIAATFAGEEPLFYYAFLKETGRLPDGIDTSFEGKKLIRETVEKIGKDQYEAWGTKKIKELSLTEEEKIPNGWTSGGNRKYLAHNLGTVVRLLTKELKDGEGFNYGVPSVRAANAIQFRSLKQIQENRDKIISPEDMKVLKEETDTEFLDLANQAIGHMQARRGFGDLDAFSDHLKEAIKTHNFNKIFGEKSEYYDSGVDVDKIIDFVNKLRNMPTEYFEGKVQRVVGLTEFERAVVPDNTPKDLIEWLTARGIGVDTYKTGDTADRQAKVKGSATEGKLLYSVEKDTNAAYLAAVEAGDIATAQKLVDMAAKEAGYNVGPVYHGGVEPNVTVFDPKKAGTIQTADWGTGVYFNPGRDSADYYREEAVTRTDKKSNDLWDEYEAEAKRLGTSPMNSTIDLGFGTPELKQLDEYFERWKAAREAARKGGGGAIYAAHLALHNPLVYQYEGVTDPFLADQAKEHGHDGIIVISKYTEPGESLLDRTEEILVFKPEQIKSADPMTYDGEGKVIPLSERFDKKTPNIRYAVGDEKTGTAKLSLKTVQDAFKGQSVVPEGENFTLTLKNGATATIMGVARITPNSLALDMGYKPGYTSGRGKVIAGSFGRDAEGRAVIRVVRDNEDARWVLGHETVHLLVDLGILTKAHLATVSVVARKDGTWNDSLSAEENQANWLADFMSKDKPAQSVLAEIWQKIQDFVNRLVGIRTAEMIGREMESGKIFNGETTTQSARQAVRDLFHPSPEQYAVKKDPVDSASLFSDVDKNLKAAKGLKTATGKERVKEALVTGWAHFTRHFQHLDKEDAGIADVLRTFQDVPAWAKEETVNQLSSFVGKLTPQGRDVFTMNILLPDMLRDIDDGTLSVTDEGGLPFGYKDRDQVQQDLSHYKAIAEANPAIAEALAKRTAFMAGLTDQLIANKLLKKDAAKNPSAYFHHQVLYYMNYRDNPTFGMSSQDVRTHRKGWQLGRKGSRLDYNTEYVESEFEVISQALTQIETVKTLKEVERLADIKPGLVAEAKDQNMDIFAHKTANQQDPLKPFRSKIAIGFQKLTKLIKDGNLSVPEEFDEVAEFIMSQEDERKAATEEERDYNPVPHPKMFAFLNYLINHQDSGGAMSAAMIFKAIAGRNAYIKQVVGKDWVTYRDLIPAGFVVHKPESKSTFYFTNGIADQALDAVLAGHKSLPEAVRQVLARGRDEEWVVRDGVSKTLNEFRPRLEASLPATLSKGILTTWKQWILMNPFRVIKYNLNNMSGDLDIAMAYDPKIITGYFNQAFKDLWAASRGNLSEDLKAELSDLTKRGVIGSGMTQMDIPELGDVKSVKDLVDFFDGKSKNALSRWYTYSKKLSTLRENILRLAANRYFLAKLNKGEYVNPGASNKAEIDQVRKELGIEATAAKLARELIGDYGNISHAGQYMRERLIPFYSWLEINAPRYVRLFRNLKDEGAGGVGAMGGLLAWKATKLSVKAFALMGLVMLWNAAMFPDEEDELQETGREQLHLILGRRADGSIITLRFQGALSDALSWFGMSNPLEQAKKVIKGTKGMKDVAMDVVKATPLKLFQGIRPEAKLAYEVLSGQSFYPDPTHPRPIRDTTEHILRTFSLDKIYDRVAGKPKQGGTWEHQLYRDVLSLALNEVDPGEQAYYTTRKNIFDWLDSQGKEKPTAIPTNRSNALYYYKQALKYGDIDAAAKYLKKYQDMGGKMHDVQGSIKRVHPLSSLKISDRYKFRQSLSPEQAQTLEVATAWYKKHYVEAYREQRRAASGQ